MTPFARIAIAMLALAVPVVAQQKPAAQKPAAPQKSTVTPTIVKPNPNFSGRWIIVSPKEGAGKEQLVTQNDKTLMTERGSSGNVHKMVYQLDGVQRRLALPPQGSDITMLAKASWNAGRIVITTDTSYPNGLRTHGTDTWSMDAQGQLVIDLVETGPDGVQAPAMKIIYNRKK